MDKIQKIIEAIRLLYEASRLAPLQARDHELLTEMAKIAIEELEKMRFDEDNAGAGN